MKKSDGKLVIFGFNPNKSYNLLCGNHLGCDIIWQLITDGEIIDNTLIKFNDTYYPDPSSPDSISLKLRDYLDREVVIDNASFSIYQGIKSHSVETAYIFTETLDKKILKKLADAALESWSIGKSMTSEKPNVFYLSLRRKQ